MGMAPAAHSSGGEQNPLNNKLRGRAAEFKCVRCVHKGCNGSRAAPAPYCNGSRAAPYYFQHGVTRYRHYSFAAMHQQTHILVDLLMHRSAGRVGVRDEDLSLICILVPAVCCISQSSNFLCPLITSCFLFCCCSLQTIISQISPEVLAELVLQLSLRTYV
jgi:hypothetical protein